LDADKYPNPLEELDSFEVPSVEPLRLPIVSLVFETRPEMMGRINQIIRWHRKFFKFHREIVISTDDPHIPGTTFVNCGILPPQDKLRMWYSDMCVHFLNHLCDTSHMLIWQWDGFIINADLWKDDFYQWDYMGAPLGGAWRYYAHCMKQFWPNWKNPYDAPGQHEAVAGNGGFSFRSKKFLEATDALPRTGMTCEAEDLYLCIEKREELEAKGLKFSSPKEAAEFSVEGGDPSNSFGFHNRDELLTVKMYLEQKYIPPIPKILMIPLGSGGFSERIGQNCP